jgi:hypothetical protein
MYVCGITPYDSTHLGHAATYLTYDLLIRRLQDLGHEVRMVRNITDVDDSILPKARELGVPYLDLADAEVFLKACGLQLDAQVGARVEGSRPHINADHAHAPARGYKEAFDRTQDAGLPGSIGAKQTEDLARPDGETHTVDGDSAPVGDSQLAYLEQRGGGIC